MTKLTNDEKLGKVIEIVYLYMDGYLTPEEAVNEIILAVVDRPEK